ncbi:hypothetical protein D3C80_1753120 [compost metagenome]
MAVLVREATLTSMGFKLTACGAVSALRRVTVRASLNCQPMPLPASNCCNACSML